MLNSINYQGRLTAEPELKQAGGFPCLDFTIAWNDKYKEKESTCFLRCKAWSGIAEFISKWFHKGDQIIIEGRLETESWDNKDGQRQSMVVCRVDKAHFCNGSKPKTVDEAVDKWVAVNGSDDEELPFT